MITILFNPAEIMSGTLSDWGACDVVIQYIIIPCRNCYYDALTLVGLFRIIARQDARKQATDQCRHYTGLGGASPAFPRDGIQRGKSN